MTAPKRLTIKLFIDKPVAASRIVPIFQRWIQRNQVEGLLIDVADYQHVHNGPGIILIGYEGDYAYDFGDNRVGIQYTLKQTAGLAFTEAFAISLRRVLQAAHQLEVEKSLSNLQINTNELQIRLRDRLNYPNNSDTWLEIIPEIQSVLSRNHSSDLSITALEGDDREALTLSVKSFEAVSFAELLGGVVVQH